MNFRCYKWRVSLVHRTTMLRSIFWRQNLFHWFFLSPFFPFAKNVHHWNESTVCVAQFCLLYVKDVGKIVLFQWKWNFSLRNYSANLWWFFVFFCSFQRTCKLSCETCLEHQKVSCFLTRTLFFPFNFVIECRCNFGKFHGKVVKNVLPCNLTTF